MHGSICAGTVVQGLLPFDVTAGQELLQKATLVRRTAWRLLRMRTAPSRSGSCCSRSLRAGHVLGGCARCRWPGASSAAWACRSCAGRARRRSSSWTCRAPASPSCPPFSARFRPLSRLLHPLPGSTGPTAGVHAHAHVHTYACRVDCLQCRKFGVMQGGSLPKCAVWVLCRVSCTRSLPTSAQS